MFSCTNMAPVQANGTKYANNKLEMSQWIATYSADGPGKDRTGSCLRLDRIPSGGGGNLTCGSTDDLIRPFFLQDPKIKDKHKENDSGRANFCVRGLHVQVSCISLVPLRANRQSLCFIIQIGEQAASLQHVVYVAHHDPLNILKFCVDRC